MPNSLITGREYTISPLSPASPSFHEGDVLIKAKYLGYQTFEIEQSHVFVYEKNGRTVYLLAPDFAVRDRIVSPVENLPFSTFDTEDIDSLLNSDTLRRKHRALSELVRTIGVNNGS